MWIFTKEGFYSVVQPAAGETDSEVAVRARSYRDIGRLIRWLQEHGHDCEMVLTPKGDYCCRVLIPKPLWAEYVRQAAEEIDYDNFKEVATKGDRLRHDAYFGCWEALWRWQTRQGA